MAKPGTDQRQRGQVKEVIRFLFLAQSPHVVDKYRRGQFNDNPNHFKWGHPLGKREVFFRTFVFVKENFLVKNQHSSWNEVSCQYGQNDWLNFMAEREY
jgi:hypothetical protein